MITESGVVRDSGSWDEPDFGGDPPPGGEGLGLVAVDLVVEVEVEVNASTDKTVVRAGETIELRSAAGPTDPARQHGPYGHDHGCVSLGHTVCACAGRTET